MICEAVIYTDRHDARCARIKWVAHDGARKETYIKEENNSLFLMLMSDTLLRVARDQPVTREGGVQ